MANDDKVEYHLGDYGMSWPTNTFATIDETTIEMMGGTLFVSLDTIIRNALNSYDDRPGILKAEKSIVERVREDLSLLRGFVEQTLNGKVVVYEVNYDNMQYKGLTKRRELKTDFQKATARVHAFAKKSCIEDVDVHFKTHFHNNHSGNLGKSFIMTHMAVDLLHASSFPNLALLESFTGVIRKANQFNAKLNIDKSLREHIPLTPRTVRIFGDKELFAPLPGAVRKQIISIAKANNWTPMTTETRVMFSVQRSDKPLYDALSSLV